MPHQLHNTYTVSYEAFAILTLENKWDHWMAMANSVEWKHSPVRTKWTVTRDDTPFSSNQGKTSTKSDGKSGGTGVPELPQGPQAWRYQGWSAHKPVQLIV
jgi:hypothetical protein